MIQSTTLSQHLQLPLRFQVQFELKPRIWIVKCQFVHNSHRAHGKSNLSPFFSYPLDGSVADAKLCAAEAPAAKDAFSETALSCTELPC